VQRGHLVFGVASWLRVLFWSCASGCLATSLSKILQDNVHSIRFARLGFSGVLCLGW